MYQCEAHKNRRLEFTKSDISKHQQQAVTSKETKSGYEWEDTEHEQEN